MTTLKSETRNLLSTQPGRAALAGVGALAASSIATDIQPIADLLAMAGIEHPQRVGLLVWAIGWLVDTIISRRVKARHSRRVRDHEQSTRVNKN